MYDAQPPLLPTLIERFCRGRGAEIGPGKHPRCDPETTITIDRFTDNADASLRPDIVADAAHIPLCDGALDFLLSSHMLEHHQDTLRTLYEWKRVLKPNGGTLVLILPHYERTFDRFRAVTRLRHHIEDYERRVAEDDPFHFEEIREGWSKIDGFEELRHEFEAQWKMDMWDWTGRLREGVIHFHVWSQNEMVDLLRYAGFSISYVADEIPEISNSFLVAAKIVA
jgi:SAM-dependent methyltransferase